MNCEQCDAALVAPFRFCGGCGHQQSEGASSKALTHYHYSGGNEQRQLAIDDIIERILAAPDADHLLWTDGWTDWKPWRSVDAVAEPTSEALAVRNEDPARIAEYQELVAEMAADGVIEKWELDVLTERRRALGISKATHDRLVAEHKTVGSGLLTAQVDEAAMAAFRVGESCVLRLRVRNEGNRGLASIRAQVATSSSEGLVEVSATRLAPGGDDLLLVRLKPEVAGQHELNVLFTTVGYDRSTSAYRSRAQVFQVARAPTQGGARVYNVDLSAMQVGKIGNLGQQESSAGGLLGDAKWVPLPVTPMSPSAAEAWLTRHGNHLPGLPAPPKAPRSEPYSQAPPAPKSAPESSFHYAGPTGQEELSASRIIALIQQAHGADHHVWKEGWDGWKAWTEVPELASQVEAVGDDILSGRPWTHWPEGVRDWTCGRVEADSIALRLTPASVLSLVHDALSPVYLLDGVDAHELVRCGLSDGLTWQGGKLYASVDPGALLASGRQSLISRVAPSWPGAFGGVLRQLDAGDDIREAWKAAQWASWDSGTPSALVAAALQADLTEEARTLAVRSSEIPELGPNRRLLEGLRASICLLGDEMQARRVMAQVEHHRSPRRAQATQSAGWLALVEASLFGDAEAATRQLQQTTDSRTSDRLLSAQVQRLLFDDPRAALRSLVRAQAQLDADGDSPSHPLELTQLAVAWATLADDPDEARSTLTAAEAATRRHPNGVPMVAATWAALFDDTDRCARLLGSLRGSAAQGTAVATAWSLVPDGLSRIPKPSGSTPDKAAQRALSQASLFASRDAPDRVLRALHRAETRPSLQELPRLAWSWRWLVDDADSARRCLTDQSKGATASTELVPLADAARALGLSDIAVRLMVRAESKAASSGDFVAIARAWAGPVHSDRMEHDRTFQAAFDWGTAHAADDPSYFERLQQGLQKTGPDSSLLVRFETHKAKIEARLAAAEAKRQRDAEEQRQREARRQRERQEAARQARVEAEREAREAARRKADRARERARAEAARAEAARAKQKSAVQKRKDGFAELKRTSSPAGAAISPAADQAWWVSESFPKPIIRWGWAQDWYVLSLFYLRHKKKWLCVMSKHADYKSQGWKYGSEAEAREYIKRKTGEGSIITALAIRASQWAVVMSKVEGASRPKFHLSKKYPGDWLQGRFNNNERILGMTSSPTHWVVWSAKFVKRLQQGCYLRNGWTSTRDHIREKWSDDYYLTAVTHKSGSNMIAMTKGVQTGAQRYTRCSSVPNFEKQCNTDWGEGRKILFVGHDDERWWLATSKGLSWI